MEDFPANRVTMFGYQNVPEVNWALSFHYNVGKTITSHPPVITMFIGGINLPLPVMGGLYW